MSYDASQGRQLKGEPPRLKLPPKATDTHMHIYDDRFPGRDGGPPKPPLPASLDDYRQLQQWLELERVVFVQGAAYQFDNACLLDALDRFGEGARGIAVVGRDVSEETLADLTQRGVRGARIMHLPGGAVGMKDLLTIDARTRPFGWSPIVQFDGRDIADYVVMLESLTGDYVIDHAGKFLEPVGTDAPCRHKDLDIGKNCQEKRRVKGRHRLRRRNAAGSLVEGQDSGNA
jgi:D-galactarolactone isomerase